MELLLLFIAGCGGSLVKEILKDGYLTLPYLHNKKLYLGFAGSVFVGGTIGIIVDHSYITAFLSGYVGFSVIEGLILKKFPLINNKKKLN